MHECHECQGPSVQRWNGGFIDVKELTTAMPLPLLVQPFLLYIFFDLEVENTFSTDLLVRVRGLNHTAT